MCLHNCIVCLLLLLVCCVCLLLFCCHVHDVEQFLFYTLQLDMIKPRSLCHTVAVLAGFGAPYERGGVLTW